jgi:hypothetical protein
MRRSIFCLIVGIFCTALLGSAVSVYLFHDVDRDMVGRLNEAFLALCIESILFALIVGGAAGLLTALGRLAFRLRGYSPYAMPSFFLGVGVTVLQYPWDFSARKLFPKLADLSLSIYLAAAIGLCTVVLLRGILRRKKAFEAARDSLAVSRP